MVTSIYQCFVALGPLSSMNNLHKWCHYLPKSCKNKYYGGLRKSSCSLSEKTIQINLLLAEIKEILIITNCTWTKMMHGLIHTEDAIPMRSASTVLPDHSRKNCQFCYWSFVEKIIPIFYSSTSFKLHDWLYLPDPFNREGCFLRQL